MCVCNFRVPTRGVRILSAHIAYVFAVCIGLVLGFQGRLRQAPTYLLRNYYELCDGDDNKTYRMFFPLPMCDVEGRDVGWKSLVVCTLVELVVCFEKIKYLEQWIFKQGRSKRIQKRSYYSQTIYC